MENNNKKLEFKLKYGNEKIEFKLDQENVIDVLAGNKVEPLQDPLEELKKLLENPIGSLSLQKEIESKKAEKVLIVVNDITRPTPYDIILPPLLEKLAEIGLKKENIIFIVATGSHRGNTEEENRAIFGPEIVSSYKFINHCCDEEGFLDFGNLKSGNHLSVNPIIKEVDFVITTGVIVPHYIAGFSGGRKSILPGICARKTIENNHANMVHPRAFKGNLDDNPVHNEMLEAAEKVGVDFIINVVTDQNGDIIGIVAGDLKESWKKGLDICQHAHFCPIRKKADVVIVSAGGYPKDINMYQSQKALDNAYEAVKKDGTIVLIADCENGLGSDIFAEWMESATSIADIENRLKKKFILGGHKAYAIARVAKEVDILLVSSLSEKQTEKLFMKYCTDINDAINYIQKKHGQDFSSYIMPSGGALVPFVISGKKE